MNNKNTIAKIIAAISIIIVLATGFIVMQLGPYDKDSSKEIIVEIPQGSNSSTIANDLAENNLIKNEMIFKLYVKLSNKGSEFKAGTYSFKQSYSNKDIVNIIANGDTIETGIKVTIPEGSTSNEIVSILVKNSLGNEDTYKELINDPKSFYDEFEFLKEDDIISLEGFLYPETYYIDEELNEKQILSIMISQFDRLYTDDLKSKQKEMDMTLQEVINLSSIVEKEAVLDEDRPIIASVFYNRLDIDMPLQSDATIQYIFDERKGIVTYNDLKIDSPYNSYKFKGLPPTPIASPGIKSIKATLNPDETNYLYFVATMEGGNNYSETYDQHLIYEKEYKDERDKLNKE